MDEPRITVKEDGPHVVSGGVSLARQRIVRSEQGESLVWRTKEVTERGGPYHSLGWGVAGDDQRLVGFVNVAWDGGVHAFHLDTLAARTHRGQGIETLRVQCALRGPRAAGGSSTS